MVSYRQLHHKNCHGHLQVQAVLQHLWLCHRCLCGEIDGHQAFKLLPEAVSSRARTLLSFSPCYLQAVKALVYLYHLVMQPRKKKKKGEEDTRQDANKFGTDCLSETQVTTHCERFCAAATARFQNVASLTRCAASLSEQQGGCNAASVLSIQTISCR